ncbi:hypothetical protein GCM10023222_01120 [Saccharopolyspora cebuensis]
MRTSVRILAATAATAALMAIGSPAFADGGYGHHHHGGGNDGVNLLNDNNLNLLPLNLCGNNVAVLGIIVPIASPQSPDCLNAPIVD